MGVFGKIKRMISVFVLFAIIVVFNSTTLASAATIPSENVPSHSYSYWDSISKSTLVKQKAVFKFKETLTSTSLGISSFSTLADMSIDKNGSIYLIDKDTNDVIVIDKNHNYIKTISNFIYNGNDCEINRLAGIYVSDNNDIYLCDNEGGKIVVCDFNGNVSTIITVPSNSTLPEGFVFKPIKVVLDSKDYMFVLSEGSYYGAMIYNPKGEFIGFYGANKVSSTVGDVIKTFWKNLTTTNARRANSAKTLPYTFTDICIDDKGFVYTATGATTERGLQKGVIRRLSPNGVNILFSENEVFGEKVTGKQSLGGVIWQNICGVCIDEYGFVYAYDRTIGNIYMYDEECNLITAFGGGMGEGTQGGTYNFPCAIEMNNNNLYVCDSLTGIITVYELTDYGIRLRDLQRKTLDGEYESTKEGWQKILKENKNCQLAYIGLANVAFSEEDYALSLDYAKQGEDRETYAKAFEKVRDTFLREHFVVLFCAAVLAVLVIISILVFKKKKGFVLIKNNELKLALNSVIHPFDVFGEMKEKNKGSLIYAVIFLVLFYISSVIKNDFSGFLFVDQSAIEFNSLVVLLRTIGAVLLWTLSNWMIAALFNGLGKIKEIFVVVTYSLLPMTIMNFAYTIISRCLSESEASFLSLAVLLCQAYFVIILAIGTMKIHDFGFGKFVGTSILSIICLLLIVFIVAMVIILAQQFVSFFATLSYEIILR